MGLPENHLFVRCSITSSSKNYVAALLKGSFEDSADNKLIDIPVVISDLPSIDQRLCNRTHEGALGQGIWCREDGCVFNAVFCPFCDSPDNCLGVQVMATDASNIHLLDKVLFYHDRLEIKDSEASKEKVSLQLYRGICWFLFMIYHQLMAQPPIVWFLWQLRNSHTSLHRRTPMAGGLLDQRYNCQREGFFLPQGSKVEPRQKKLGSIIAFLLP
ncbi:hypothetical protein Vadar_026020 [Vaccinium darrowii]|uniref:Uncharacterized protein n=1 Tax=Vaccinium darrowii TaxID=229202 RepID=A0ACB7Y9H4_9ERIC|nr:hypothetical protein Vadar_026020 [Vaccinium darrowii]